MAKKTYRTYHLKGLQILLFDDNGRQTEVNFRSGAQIDSTAKFTTSDEKVQEALEKCSGFERDYYIESVREETPATAPAPTTTAKASAENKNTNKEEVVEDGGKQVVKVADKSEAIEWLKEHYPEAGYTATKLRTEAAFTAACKERGVEFVYEG